MITCLSATGGSAATDVLRAIRDRGQLNCGVSEGAVGFSSLAASGRWQGMNADLCRALAAAILGSPDKVTFLPIPSSRRFAALREREIDILARMTAWTFSREQDTTAIFTAPYYHGSYAFMTLKSNGLTSALELTGATVCLLAGSRAELAAGAFFSRYGMKYQAVRSETWTDVVKSYQTGRCLVVISDRVTLAHMRSGLDNRDAHALLPESTGTEAFGPLVTGKDERWARIVRWVIYGLIAAEDAEVKSSNAAALRDAAPPHVRRLLGTDGAIGSSLGLANDWLFAMVREVGNYGEIFERNLGSKSPLLLTRDKNALARNGGLMYAPAFR